MIRFLRYLFGLHGVTGNRTVVGSPESIDTKDLPYIQDSTQRLAALQQLYELYKGTPNAQRFYTVYEKTKRIHHYLLGRNKAQELELFHLQHTDHFLNTFTAIIEAHQHRYQQKHVQEIHQTAAPPPPKKATRSEVIGRTLVLGPFRHERKEVKAVQMQNREASRRILMETMQTKALVTTLSVPDISIDTYSKIMYLREDISDGLTTNEIGYTSSEEEKEAFVKYLTAHLGLENTTYIGNAMVHIPATSKAASPAEMVPVINWNGATYALSLEDYRLFPVRAFGMGR